MAGVLCGWVAGVGEHWNRVSDGDGVRDWGEVSGEISEGDVHLRLDVRAADCGASGTGGGELPRNVGEFRGTEVAAQCAGEGAFESDGCASGRRRVALLHGGRARDAGGFVPGELSRE